MMVRTDPYMRHCKAKDFITLTAGWLETQLMSLDAYHHWIGEIEPAECIYGGREGTREKERERENKELAHAGMKVWKFKLCRVGRQAGDAEAQFKSKGSLLTELLFAQGSSVFVLVSPLTDWMRIAHIIEVIYFTQSLSIYILISLKKTFTETSRTMPH